MTTYIFPTDPLGGRVRRVDDHFAGEYNVASESASVALLDIYSLSDTGARPRLSVPDGSEGPFIYRGWMLTAEEYMALEREVSKRGHIMLTDTVAYMETHSIAGWVHYFRELTPRNALFNPRTMDAADAVEAAQKISPEEHYFLRGLTKSEPEFSRADGSDELLARLADLGESFGAEAQIVIRNREELDGTVSELRSWWVRGELFELDIHPNFNSSDRRSPFQDPALLLSAKAFLGELRPIISQLRSGFLTADIALKADGSWTLIELGDGQVSGLPRWYSEDELGGFYDGLTESIPTGDWS